MVRRMCASQLFGDEIARRWVVQGHLFGVATSAIPRAHFREVFDRWGPFFCQKGDMSAQRRAPSVGKPVSLAMPGDSLLSSCINAVCFTSFSFSLLSPLLRHF